MRFGQRPLSYSFATASAQFGTGTMESVRAFTRVRADSHGYRRVLPHAGTRAGTPVYIRG